MFNLNDNNMKNLKIYIIAIMIVIHIIEVYPENGYILSIRFQYLASATEGYVALQKRSDGKVAYCGLIMDESKPYIDGLLAIGDFEENVRSINK